MLGFYNYTTWLTYMGLLSGVTGIFFAAQGNELGAILCLALSGFFDLFDGKVAATKKDRTDDMKKFGIQIDSLSDLVCFCVLPSVILLARVKKTLPEVNPFFFLPLGGVFVLAGLIRLAYFNVAEEHRQKKEKEVRKTYNGVPVTMTSIAIPFFLALYQIAQTIFANGSNVHYWDTAYLVFYCIELTLFAFGFLCNNLKVMKIHGKKMLIPVIIGLVAVCVVFFVRRSFE